MSVPLEYRRQVVVHALRAVEAHARAESMERRLADLSERLSAVETTLLEAAWAQPSVAPADDTSSAPDTEAGQPVDVDVDETDEVETGVTVPPVALGDARMSSVASRILFGH